MSSSSAASMSRSRSARGSMRMIASTPPAPAARPSSTWYASTRKSLRMAGTPSGASARAPPARSSSEPSKRLGSVSIDTAAAPALAYMRDARAHVLFACLLEQTHRGRAQFHFGDEVEAAELQRGRGRQVRDARAQLALGKLRLRGRRARAARCRHALRGNRRSQSRAPRRTPPAHRASCARRRCRWPACASSHAVARVVDAADDFQRQRRA